MFSIDRVGRKAQIWGMKNRITQIAALVVVTASAAFAHSGVKDPQVLARMHVMGLVADDMEDLGGILKGQAPYDDQFVRDRSTRILEHARQIEALFEPEATDPKTEAKDTIWTDWPGFLEKARDMELAAQGLTEVQSEAEFRQAFAALGKTCSACHADYRIKLN